MPGALLLILIGCAAPPALVEIQQVSPGIRLDIRYATPNNFTGRAVYQEARCFLRPETARKLADVQKDLERSGLGLKVYDCYRPLSIQRRFWELVPDERYVANPAKGSRHNRGAAVDLTLVDARGKELPMPTPYDDFTKRAHRDFCDLPPEALRNRETLERVMVKHGFIPLPTEWWHFDDTAWEKYGILDLDFTSLRAR